MDGQRPGAFQPTLVEALTRAGLELEETAGNSGDAEYLISGNTFANRDLLKRCGGRWSQRRQRWVFPSGKSIESLAAAIPAEAAPPGLAEAPVAYDAEGGSFSRRRRTAQQSGHRNRLRQRFLEAGPTSLPDYELLELLLFFSIDVKDTKPLAKELLARYGNLGAVLKAEPGHLLEFHDLRRDDPALDEYAAYRLSDLYERDRQNPEARSEAGQRWQAFEEDQDGRWEIVRLWRRRETEILFKLVTELLQRVLREQIQERPVISSWSALLDYLQVALTHEPIEQFRVMFLDRKNILIKDEVQQRGTVDHTPLYPREIVKRALELAASSIIMVHNHPSGDPTPSRADLEMTKQVVSALGAVGIQVHDHVIVGKNKHLSFKSQRLM
jgi:DNA repair protein RadC